MSSSYTSDMVSVAAMVVVEFALVGISTVSKAAMTSGMNRYVFAVYQTALASLILLPSFIFNRKRPPLTVHLFYVFVLLGFIGSSIVILQYTGLDYSSPTLASALMNLVPALTFILACIFRMEKFDIRSKSSQAKSLGTILSVTGAIIATLYKGKHIIMSQLPSPTPQLVLTSAQSNWVIGGIFLAGAWIFLSIQIIMQGAVLKHYPSELGIAFFSCFFVSIETSIFTLIVERDLSVWRLRSGAQVVAIVYAAIAAVLMNIVHIWCLRIKGPIFVSSFKPFGIVIAVLMSCIFLGDKLYIGSVTGSIIITIGYYGVLWGKSKENKVAEDISISSLDPSSNTPLLVNINNDNDLKIKEKGKGIW